MILQRAEVVHLGAVTEVHGHLVGVSALAHGVCVDASTGVVPAERHGRQRHRAVPVATCYLGTDVPHLVAASANSPFWQGVDTGLASSRVALYRMLPHAGVPRHFRDWKEFRNFYRVMRDCRAMQSTKDIYWDIRPCPQFGTIEIRICDMPDSLATTFGLVALIRSLVVSAQRLL